MTSVWSLTAGLRAPQPEALATTSASAASCCARSAGIRGGGFVVRAGVELPQPASSSALNPASQALRQRIRQPPFANLLLGSLDRVGDAPKRGTAGAVVEQEPGRAGIAVARLSDRAGVQDKPCPRTQLRLRALGSQPARQHAVRLRERERHIAVL